MKLIEKSIVIVFIYIVTLFSMQIFATDAEGDHEPQGAGLAAGRLPGVFVHGQDVRVVLYVPAPL